MEAALAVHQARIRAGFSKRELARRAATSPAAIVAYETAAREPTLPTLRRLLRAAGTDVTMDLAPAPASNCYEVSGQRLAAVLELAEHLPRRRAAPTLRFPLLP